MTAKIYLKVVAEPAENDAVLRFAKMPAFTGSDPDENLACGTCKVVVGRNVSTLDLGGRFASSGRVILQCECGAHLLIPSHRAN